MIPPLILGLFRFPRSNKEHDHQLGNNGDIEASNPTTKLSNELMGSCKFAFVEELVKLL